MNKAILAGVAMFALLGAILAVPMVQHADAATTKTTKKETKTDTKKAGAKSTGKTTSTVTVDIAKGSADESCEKGNKCYAPFETKVKKGGTVTWTNKDSSRHTVTSGTIQKGPDGQFGSDLLDSNGKFSQKFDKAGKYDYFCTVHPWMKGKVIVS